MKKLTFHAVRLLNMGAAMAMLSLSGMNPVASCALVLAAAYLLEDNLPDLRNQFRPSRTGKPTQAD